MNLSLVETLMEKFEQIGQGHVFNRFHELSTEKQCDFLERAYLIDLNNLVTLMGAAQSQEVQKKQATPLMPINNLLTSPSKNNREDYKDFIGKGEEVIRQGRVGALLVAGGDGTRLGFSGPKGMLPVTLVKKKTLFQLFAEQIQLIQKRYQSIIPWFIMTSEGNHDRTTQYFLDNDHFGLEEVHFFKQNLCPILDFNGKLILDENGLIAMAPDGHGGCFKALSSSGLIDKMESIGIDIISYFQVDNPFVKCIDPLFIGLHVLSNAEMSCKGVKKRDASERVGLFFLENGKVKVVEYSHVSQEMLEMKDDQGELIFNIGNVGVHLINREFIQRINTSNPLHFYKTKKKVSFVDSNNNIVIPEEPNAIKFEKLIFDALPEAKNVIILEVSRKDEFSPIKNAQGEDSLESFHKDQSRRYLERFKKENISIPYDQEEIPVFNIEVSPLFADNQNAFTQKLESVAQKPEILAEIYLE